MDQQRPEIIAYTVINKIVCKVLKHNLHRNSALKLNNSMKVKFRDKKSIRIFSQNGRAKVAMCNSLV